VLLQAKQELEQLHESKIARATKTAKEVESELREAQLKLEKTSKNS
jgi:hypothetical protein